METRAENAINNGCCRKQLSEENPPTETKDICSDLKENVQHFRSDAGEMGRIDKMATEMGRKSEKKIRRCDVEIDNTDEPIDLTSTNNPNKFETLRCFGGDAHNGKNFRLENEISYAPSTSLTTNRIADIIKAERLMTTTYLPKKRGRKRKATYALINTNNIRIPLSNIDLGLSYGEGGDYFQNFDSKQAEVLKAAKSLFSKRTRTLYHWMYPNAPKQQLKAAVASSWETLGPQEKEFYISQVLGRFGFPKCSLMINPQLGGMSNIPPLNLSNPMGQSSDETKCAVSSILFNGIGSDANLPSEFPQATAYQNSQSHRESKKRRRLGRPPGSKNKKPPKEDNSQKIATEEVTVDEFQDDPELSRELEQFKWTLHLTKSK